MVIRNGEMPWPGTRLGQGKKCEGSNSKLALLMNGRRGTLNVYQVAASSRMTVGPRGVPFIISFA